MKYYFISYVWRNLPDSRWRYSNQTLKGKHPLDWLIEARSDYEENYVLVNWKEITEEEFKKIDPLL